MVEHQSRTTLSDTYACHQEIFLDELAFPIAPKRKPLMKHFSMLKMTVSMYNEIFVYDLEAIKENVGLPDTLALDGNILVEMLAARELSN